MLSKSAKIPPTWLCPACVSKQPRKDNSETPVKGVTLPSPTDQVGKEVDSLVVGRSDDGALMRELCLVRQEMAATRLKIDQIAERMEVMLVAMSRVDERLTAVENRLLAAEERSDSMDNRISVLEQRDTGAGGSASSDVTALAHTVEQLRLELNDRDQSLLSSDVEITMLPEAQGENPLHLVQLVASKLGVNLEARDVVSAERVGAPRTAGGEQDGARSGPRPLAVRLARRELRDTLLREARVRRTVDTSGFDLPGPARRFYINERLTRINRRLFGKARQEGKSRGWRFVWTRGGHIYARRQTDTQALRIRTEQDIIKVFGIA